LVVMKFLPGGITSIPQRISIKNLIFINR
jgi:hypothetical protein